MKDFSSKFTGSEIEAKLDRMDIDRPLSEALGKIYTKEELDSLLHGLQGPAGNPGPKGDPFRYSDFTPEQLAALKGEKGDPGNPGQKGDPFQYSDFTPEQLASLKGPKGDTGNPGQKGDPFQYSDFTPEQLAALKGQKGDPGNPGPKGDPFRYSDFTPEQLAALKGPKGETGWPSYQPVPGTTPTVSLAWNTVHQLTDHPTSLTVAMPAAPASSEVECVLKFTTGAAAPTVTWPSGLLWANGTPPVVRANATYEFAVSWDVKAVKYTVIGCEFKPTA